MTQPQPVTPSSTLSASSSSSRESLHQRWQTLLREQGKLRIRAAADELGVSELALRLTQIGRSGGEDEAPLSVTRLAGDWRALIERLPELGEVMVLTRNAAAVHEKVGTFGAIQFGEGFGLVLNREVDLRLFMSRWAHGVAVIEAARGGGVHRSLQFFDASGTAIHKVYLRDGSNRAAYAGIVDEWTAADQQAELAIEPVAPPAAPKPDAEIDVEGLRADWLALQDPHEFFPMLRRYEVARTQALRLAPEGHAERIGDDAIVTLLERASATKTPIMVFVGSPGCIQIHTGRVEQIKAMGPWINVLDPGFNLHLRTDMVAESWIVRKPTADGVVSSLELFDDQGQTIALLFGEREAGTPELAAWRALLGELSQAAQA
ncbi:hemin-degrading factor [Pseudenhygromyxa sp. WMMC2535]|uniref:hemin-degrading factor n=1 Tax=Pseudenhygromyxa sp. WMMC2535 TaxID=2712867 RepID=UPI001556B48E|nr:ChuX/HutX family heme-like substrate-binding protein [Pseudenhygromyxa sp. WMMC2535]NVB39889.1 hemin-degrading factor [Pseudenhygromyxa sp. WMMC2535]